MGQPSSGYVTFGIRDSAFRRSGPASAVRHSGFGIRNSSFCGAKLNSLARHQFAVIALVALALTSSFWVLLDVVSVYSKGGEPFGAAAFENRYDEARKTLQQHKVLGYVSDNSPSDPVYQAEYYLTQYTLAPTIVKASIEEPFVVYNFHSSAPDQNALKAMKLFPIQSFGQGLLLCRRNP